MPAFLIIYVPDLAIESKEDQEAEEEFNDLFNDSDEESDEDAQVEIDIMGESYALDFAGEDDEFSIFTSVQLGYQVAEQVFDIEGNDISEDTYLGFVFATDVPNELIEDGQIITQWARYCVDTTDST